jgi:hypothetical protein
MLSALFFDHSFISFSFLISAFFIFLWRSASAFLFSEMILFLSTSGKLFHSFCFLSSFCLIFLTLFIAYIENQIVIKPLWLLGFL